jgi:hypothetical protein
LTVERRIALNLKRETVLTYTVNVFDSATWGRSYEQLLRDISLHAFFYSEKEKEKKEASPM